MTPAQRITLDNVRSFYFAHGRGPKIREMMALENTRSISGIHSRLNALVDMGYLIRLRDRVGGYVPANDREANPLAHCTVEELRRELERRERAK